MSQTYGRIDSAMAEHFHFRGLSVTAKLICYHLRVTARCNAIGCFYYPASQIADDLDIPFEGASEALFELAKHRFAVYCEKTRFVLIPKLLTRFPVKGRNSAKHALGVLETVPREFTYIDDLVAVFERNHDWSGDKLEAELEAEWARLKRVFEGACEGPSKGDRLSATATEATTTTETDTEPPAAGVCLSSTNECREIFEYWQAKLGKLNAMFTAERAKLISEALALFSKADLMLAIDGLAMTPWNLGENENGTRFDGLEVVFKNPANIERFRDTALNPPKPVRKVTRQGEQFQIGGEMLYLPAPIEGNDCEIKSLAERFEVSTRGRQRTEIVAKLRDAMQRAETQ